MNTRTLLFLLLAFLGFMIYVEWQNDFAPDAPPAPVEELPEGAAPPERAESEVPARPDDVPELPDAAPQPSQATQDAPPETPQFRSSQRIEVETDLVRAQIDPVGGSIVSLALKKYPVSVDRPDEPIALLTEDLPAWHVARSGLVDAAGSAPNHTSRYEWERDFYEVAPGEDSVTVPLTWRGDGLEVVQTWTFHRNDYVIEHAFRITNESGQDWQGSRYLQLQRTVTAGEGSGMSFTNPERISYFGAAVYDPEEKFVKLPFDEFAEERYAQTFDGGWAGMVEHYFLSAWIPPSESAHRYTTQFIERTSPQRYALSATSTPVVVAAGTTGEFTSRLFAGPKKQERLDDIAPGLSLTVDYGMFTVFSKPLFWLLDFIHEFVGNWGVAIILLTLLIKLVFYKLTQAQFRSMGKMRKLQPRIQQLKERYGDDRQKFGQAMMEIYKKEKVNPLGGCLPILVQIPIFIALYWVLLESVELRQASFLWVPDLSKPDPYFILPVINGIFMIVTQRLTPVAGMDPMQRKIMQWLPVAFAVLFAFFPAGLVLYWASNSGISLLQQWYILRQLEAEDARARA